MLNIAAKVYNESPKPNSKNQKKKAQALKDNPPVYVVCAECGRHDVTLYKNDCKYYCKEHLKNSISATISLEKVLSGT